MPPQRSQETMTADEIATSLDAERRAEARRNVRVPCRIWLFDSQGKVQEVLEGVTHNSSFCGLALTARLPEPLQAGVPIQVAIGDPNDSPYHEAGTVAYCRPMGATRFEIGIHVKAAGEHKILTGDMETSKARYDWFASALQIAGESSG